MIFEHASWSQCWFWICIAVVVGVIIETNWPAIRRAMRPRNRYTGQPLGKPHSSCHRDYAS